MAVASAKLRGTQTEEPQDDFYGDGLSDDEKRLLPAARLIQGFDEEIALLRVKLLSAIKAHPEDLRILTHGIDALVKAVATRYRLSPQARRDLAAQITAVLNSLGDQLLPPGR